MIKHLYVWFLMALASAPLAQADSGPHLTLLTEENPPYNFTNTKTGQVEGSAVEIVGALMKKAGVGYTLAVLPGQRAIRQAQATPGTCFFVFNRTPKREPHYTWVGPLITGGWAIYRRPGSDIKIDSLDDLKGHIIAGKMGSASVETLETDAGVKVIRTSSDELAARMLYHGRADLWVSGVIDGPAAAHAIGLPAPELALLWKKADLSLACGKGTSPELIKKLNEVNTTLDDLRQKALAHYVPGRSTSE